MNTSATTPADPAHMRRQARAIFQAGLAAVEPEQAVLRHVTVSGSRLTIGGRHYALDDFERLLVVGAGKAVAPMARALERLLGARISGGCIVVKEGHGLDLARIRVREAGHPVPDARGVSGTDEILSLTESATARDLVIGLISGGGSALLVAPAEGITLADKQATTQLLLACGATIHEMNAVRKHLSAVKGGRLARAAHPAALASLILSDVVGDDLDVIASGPAVPDASTFSRARGVLEKYRIWQQVPAAVRAHIGQGLCGRIDETPKAGDVVFKRCQAVLVGTNLQALEAAARAARKQGYAPLILSARIEGETRAVALVHAAIAAEVRASGHPLAAPACILSGGETTVTLTGDGQGGRNMEFVLACVHALDGQQGVLLMSAGTDGTDGPTDAAGAMADGATAARARESGLDPEDFLRRNDSYRFFAALDDLLITGPTRTNVMDMRIMLIQNVG